MMIHLKRKISGLPFIVIFLQIYSFGSACPFNALYAQELSKNKSLRPVRLNGNISANSTSYSVSGIDARREPFSWIFTGSVNLSLFGIDVPFSATVSEQQRAFRQPFNQIGVSPSYKWMKLHAGYRSMYFSRYTLAGATFLGSGIELNPGFLRFSCMYGRFQKAVEEDTTAAFPIIPAYERKGFGAKVGFGSNKSYLDFIFFKAKDDSSSLSTVPSTVDVLPSENLVLGINTRINFASRQ
jgi:hypothetical protein